VLNNLFSNLGSGAFAVAIFVLLAFGAFGIGLVVANLICRTIPLDVWLIRKLNLTPYTSAGLVTSLAHSSHYIGFKQPPPIRLEARALAVAARREADSFLQTIHHAQRAERIDKERAIRNRRIRSDGSRLLDNGAVVLREARACSGCGGLRKIFILPMPSIQLNAKRAEPIESARCLSCTNTINTENFSRNSNQKEQAI